MFKKKWGITKFHQVCDILKIANYKGKLFWEENVFFVLGTLLWDKLDMFMLNIRVLSYIDMVSLTDNVPG